jgi:hypothetical protein
MADSVYIQQARIKGKRVSYLAGMTRQDALDFSDPLKLIWNMKHPSIPTRTFCRLCGKVMVSIDDVCSRKTMTPLGCWIEIWAHFSCYQRENGMEE